MSYLKEGLDCRSNLTSAQRRKLFKSRFGEKLIADGFVYSDKQFVRVHPGELLLGVYMDLTSFGSTYLGFKMMPLCETEKNFQLFAHSPSGRRIDEYECYSKEEYPSPWRRISFENGRFEGQYRLFFDVLYNSFRKITTVADMREFDRQFPELGVPDLHLYDILPYVKLEEYSMAIKRAKKNVEQCDRALQQCINIIQHKEPRYEALLQKERSGARMTKTDQMEKELFEGYISLKSLHEKDLNEYRQTVEELQSGNFSRWERQAQENTAANDEYCKSLWPSFYRYD